MPGTDFSWLEENRLLSPAAMTVRAQAISPNDMDRLLWDAFLPRRPVDSVRLRNITTVDDRPAADRREWNARGRYIPVRTPTRREVTIVPVEAYDKIEEEEMQVLAERAFGDAAVIQRLVGIQIPDRVDRLASSIYRRLEIDAFTAWLNGNIVQRNPQTGQTFTASFGFDSARYQTAGTAWNDAGLNAYDEFLSWVQDGIDAVGSASGAIMRLATFRAIQEDAPRNTNTSNITPTRLEVINRLQQDLGRSFNILTVEHSLDVFADGGITRTRTKVFPAEKIALIPDGESVGFTAFAPVVRAMELAAAVPDASIDVRGVTITYEAANGGRELTIEAQANPLPVPDEQKMWVIDAGV